MPDLELFDTQILSYASKGMRRLPLGSTGITSVTAQEFLNAYYIPHVSRYIKQPASGGPPIVAGDLRRLAKTHGGFRKRHTDSLIIDLPGPLPTCGCPKLG